MELIKVEKLIPNPRNPRGALGDISELTKSIKKIGVMQNLTVVPADDESNEYMVIIGHRRLGAAKKAGLKELPCNIAEGLTEKEQLSIMLEENMQRADLTVVEQAEGFQMMLDLGSTEDEIAKKTGFSKQTIHHRIELAKLDRKTLAASQKNEDFQLNLKDLYELEKIEDVKGRNKILKSCTSSNQIKYNVKLYLENKKKAESKKNFIKLMEEIGIKELPDEINTWDDNVHSLSNNDILNNEITKEMIMKDIKGHKPSECLYTLPTFGGYTALYYISNEDIPRQKTEEEIKGDKQRADYQTLNDIQNCITDKFESILKSSDLKPEGMDVEEIRSICLRIALKGFGVSLDDVCSILFDVSSYEVNEEQENEVLNMSDDKILLTMAFSSICDKTIVDYNRHYLEERADTLGLYATVMKAYGYVPTDDESALMDGTHEFYADEAEYEED